MYNLLNLLRRVSLFGSYTQNFQIHWKIILVMYKVQVFVRKDSTSKGPIFLNSAALTFKTKNAICLKIVEDWIKCNKFWTRMITFCLLILSMLCMESVHSCGLSDLVRILQECSRRLFLTEILAIAMWHLVSVKTTKEPQISCHHYRFPSVSLGLFTHVVGFYE